MKQLTIILLFAIALGVVIPPSLAVMGADHENVAIGTLDVCHSATPALVSGGEMPCVNEVPSRLYQPVQSEATQIENSIFKPLLIVHQEERPPKA